MPLFIELYYDALQVVRAQRQTATDPMICDKLDLTLLAVVLLPL